MHSELLRSAAVWSRLFADVFGFNRLYGRVSRVSSPVSSLLVIDFLDMVYGLRWNPNHQILGKSTIDSGTEPNRIKYVWKSDTARKTNLFLQSTVANSVISSATTFSFGKSTFSGSGNTLETSW